MSQESNCAEIFFSIKCQAGGLQPYSKRDFNADFFPMSVEVCRQIVDNIVVKFLKLWKNRCYCEMF